MSTSVKLKEVYEVQSEYKSFYTGGTVEWTNDGKHFLCQNNGTICMVAVENQNEPVTFGEQTTDDEISEDVIFTFAINGSGTSIVSAHRSGLFKLWSRESRSVQKMWKSVHQGPVSRLLFSQGEELIVSGGADSTIRIWDPVNQLCLGTLRGCTGVVRLIVFHPDVESKIIVAAGDDEKFYAWNYDTRDLIKTFAGHFSRVTGVSFSEDRKFIVSSGRDKILILWDFATQKAVKTIPVYEALEAVSVLPGGTTIGGIVLGSGKKVYSACAGEEGIVKVWEMTEARIVYKQTNSLVEKASEGDGLAITHLFYSKAHGQLAIVSADHNILVHDCESFDCVHQLTGFSEEILDIILFGKRDRYLAMATNSNHFKVYDTTTMNCQLVQGHTDIVLSLSANGRYLLSSSKDHSVRLWQFDETTFTIRCVAVGLKHTHAVGSVAISKISGTFCVSVSQDRCLKTWKIPKSFTKGEEELPRLQCTLTELAHDKDINCVCISPNDRLVATGSQDKTAKLWDVSNLAVVGVLRGHRRGIWAVRFSPVDQILLTNAADCCIKLWSLTDMTCLKTLEGHDSSVLRVEFISNGMQLLSAGADGLIKLWSIKTSECMQTMDKHTSRIWALCVSRDESVFYSGGTDSQMIKWQDVTESKRQQELDERKEQLLQQQELTNLLSEKKLLKALRLALNLNLPLNTLKIVNEVIRAQEQDGLADTVRKLSNDHKETLLGHAVEWNTNSRNCRPAQLALHILLQEALAGRFQVSELNKHLEASLPYTERHFKRLTEYMKNLKFVEFSLHCMQPHATKTE